MAEDERTNRSELPASQTVAPHHSDPGGERQHRLESSTHTDADGLNEEPTRTDIFRGLVVDVSLLKIKRINCRNSATQD